MKPISKIILLILLVPFVGMFLAPDAGMGFGFFLGLVWLPALIIFLLIWLRRSFPNSRFGNLVIASGLVFSTYLLFEFGQEMSGISNEYVPYQDKVRREVVKEFEVGHRYHIRETYLLNGTLYREDGPAYISYFKEGVVSSERWYSDGVLHRRGGPALVEYYADGTVQKEEWYKNGEIFRLEGPALTLRYPNGAIQQQSWTPRKKRMGEGLPTIVDYFENGLKKKEIWYTGKVWHRLDGPAIVEYYRTGEIKQESWMIGSKYHREDGPAKRVYDENGKIVLSEWYKSGNRLAFE